MNIHILMHMTIGFLIFKSSENVATFQFSEGCSWKEYIIQYYSTLIAFLHGFIFDNFCIFQVEFFVCS